MPTSFDFDSQTILTIINWVFIGFIGFFALIGLLKGLAKGAIKATTRIVFVVLSAVTALILSNVLIGMVDSSMIEQVYGAVGLDKILAELEQLFSASPTLAVYIPTLLLAAVRPFIFVLLFIVLCMVTYIVGAIINKIIIGVIMADKDDEYDDRGRRRRKRYRPSGISRLIGMVLYTVCGVVVAGCMLMPISGYFVLVSDGYAALKEAEMIEATDDSSKDIEVVLKDGKDLLGVKLEQLGFGFMFDLTTSYKTESGVESSIGADVNSLIGIVPSVMDMSSMDFGDMENLDLTPLRNILTAIGKNEPIKAIGAEIMSFAGGKWLNNEEFMGLNIKAEMPEDIKDSIDPALEKLANTTRATVIDDLNDFIDEVEALASSYPEVEKMSDNDFSDLSKLEISPFENILRAIEHTEITKEIIANILSKAGTKWLAGQAFMDIDIEGSLPEDIKGILTPAYELFATANKDNVVTNLREFINLLTDVKDVMAEFVTITAQNFEDDNAAGIVVAPIRAIANTVQNEKSQLTGRIISTLISRAGTKWLNTEEFMGLNIKEQLPDEYKNSFDSILERLANTAHETLVKDMNDFADSMESFSRTVDYTNALNNGEMSVEEMTETLSEALTLLNTESAEVLKGFFETALSGAIDEGDDSGSAAVVSAIVIDALDKIVECNELGDKITVEQYASAVNFTLNYVNGKNGEVTADDVIETIIGSSIICENIRDYVVKEGSRTINLNPEEKAAVATAIEQYKAEKSGELTEEQLSALEAVKKLFGVAV